MDQAADKDGQRRRATLIGGGAVVIWGTLALFTTLTGDVPPFQLVASSFLIAFLLAFVKWIVRRERIAAHFRQPLRAWALGVGGLFGYHFFVFLALKTAPAVEANLINYLWPLLIVVFSALLPGEHLRLRHLAGAFAGFAGAALLVTGGAEFGLRTEFLTGYAAALAAALIWSSYSVANSRFADVPTDAVGAFCLVTAILAAIAHLALEATVVPSPTEWLAILGLGLGPVGGAFFLWDWGLKRGSVRALGALAYGAPLLSTLLLIVFGIAEPTVTVAVACLLIMGGAALAAGDVLGRR